jgi:hypothetical protein
MFVIINKRKKITNKTCILKETSLTQHDYKTLLEFLSCPCKNTVIGKIKLIYVICTSNTKVSCCILFGRTTFISYMISISRKNWESAHCIQLDNGLLTSYPIYRFTKDLNSTKTLRSARILAKGYDLCVCYIPTYNSMIERAFIWF